MKKGLSLLGVLLFGLIVFPSIAKAEAVFTINCPDSVERGATTQCELKVTDNNSTISQAQVTFVLTDMDFVGFTANTAVWQVSTAAAANPVILKSVDGSFSTGSMGNVSVSLHSDAVSCGKICAQIAYQATGDATASNASGETLCKQITPTGTQTSTESPKTGSFASYATLAAGAIIAVITITLARRSSKFYRV